MIYHKEVWKYQQSLFTDQKKKELIDEMKEKTLEEIKKYDERRKKGMESSLEKKENKNKK